MSSEQASHRLVHSPTRARFYRGLLLGGLIAFSFEILTFIEIGPEGCQVLGMSSHPGADLQGDRRAHHSSTAVSPSELAARRGSSASFCVTPETILNRTDSLCAVPIGARELDSAPGLGVRRW